MVIACGFAPDPLLCTAITGGSLSGLIRGIEDGLLRRQLEPQHRRALRRQKTHRVLGIVVSNERLPRDDAAGPDRRSPADLAHAHPDDALERLHVDELLDDPPPVLAVGDICLGEIPYDFLQRLARRLKDRALV